MYLLSVICNNISLTCVSVCGCVFQEAEENKGATRWPEYYIDQLRSMAAVSNTLASVYSLFTDRFVLLPVFFVKFIGPCYVLLF